MNATKQQTKNDDTKVISPLVNEKTYGERVYHRIFDLGLNYWTNLLSSAGFSHWAENGNGPFKMPTLTKQIPFIKFESTTPRIMQRSFAENVIKHDPLMNGVLDLSKLRIPFTDIHLPKIPVPFTNGGFISKINTLHGAGSDMAKELIADRAMARARSLTLLIPGFFIVIPTVWLGAKIKPWLVETLNRRHYGAEAMDDPTLKARHQAIEAEARPTFAGAFTARIATMFAAQFTAQFIGSKGNKLNELGKRRDINALKEFAIDPVTERAGELLGGAMPETLQTKFNAFVGNKGFDWSEAQMRKHLIEVGHLKLGSVAQLTPDMRRMAKEGFGTLNPLGDGHYGPLTKEATALAAKGLGHYTNASKDLGRFIAADTFYTIITACTIHPAIKLLRMIPGMSYKPKMPKDSSYFTNGETVTTPVRIKVPANEYGVFANSAPSTEPAANDPDYSVSQVSSQGPLQSRERQVVNG